MMWEVGNAVWNIGGASFRAGFRVSSSSQLNKIFILFNSPCLLPPRESPPLWARSAYTLLFSPPFSFSLAYPVQVSLSSMNSVRKSKALAGNGGHRAGQANWPILPCLSMAYLTSRITLSPLPFLRQQQCCGCISRPSLYLYTLAAVLHAIKIYKLSYVLCMWYSVSSRTISRY